MSSVKGAYLRVGITTYSRQSLQNLVDSLVDRGAIPSECLKNTKKTYIYEEELSSSYFYVGFDDKGRTLFEDCYSFYGAKAKRVNSANDLLEEAETQLVSANPHCHPININLEISSEDTEGYVDSNTSSVVNSSSVVEHRDWCDATLSGEEYRCNCDQMSFKW